MITVNEVSLNYGSRVLFEKVNLKFVPGNCYGVIGANGAGKSTFLKILAQEIKDYTGEVNVLPGSRISTLKQDHYAYEDELVLQTVIMGNTELLEVIKERDAIYAKPDFSDEDGIRAGELEERLEELGGYEAETDAAQLLEGLGIETALHDNKMSSLTGNQKVKVLLAQALFGEPDILLLDEPTNDLDIHAIKWLEDFLINYEKTVIVVSHDRHFLNSVCTHMADIDFKKITIFTGNYDFWYESSQLIRRNQKNQKKKAEEKAKELKEFIARFSANASKSKQATARKKALDKLDLGSLQASTRKFPYVEFKPEREAGDILLEIEGLSKASNGKNVLENIDFELLTGEKVAFFGDEIAISTFFDIIAGEEQADSGAYKWGVTTTQAYFPADNSAFFDNSDLNLVDWLRQFSEEKDESYIRGFLGRMLFSGEEALKKTSVLSGGEKVRMMLSKMMMSGANILILDQPTSHLDLESIQALNDALKKFPGNVLFASHDYQFVETVANRIIEIKDGKFIDHKEGISEYLDKSNAVFHISEE